MHTEGCKSNRHTPSRRRPSRGMLVAFSLMMAMFAGFSTPRAGADGRQTATQSLCQAEQAVREARERDALWTTALDALRAARAAFAKEDFASAERQARVAIEQARLGIAQLHSPPLRF